MHASVAVLAAALSLGLTIAPVHAGSSFSFSFHGGSGYYDGYRHGFGHGHGKHWKHYRGHRVPRFPGYRGLYYGPGGHYGYRPPRGSKGYHIGPSRHYRGPRPRCIQRFGKWYCR